MYTIQTIRGADFVVRDADGAIIPIDSENADFVTYQKWVSAGNEAKRPAQPETAPPTADDIRAEASRRIQAMYGARDADHLQIIISNASREALRLLQIRLDRAWTVDEARRAAELKQADAAMEAMRARCNEMEANPPADYQSDARWR